jgi:cell division protein FtsB
MAQLIIKHHRPYQIAAIIIIISLILSISTLFFIDDSHWAYIKSRISIGQQSRQLWDENRNLVKENDKLHDRIIMLERTTQIDSQAAAELHNETKKLQDEVYELRGELEFYQNIMSSTGSSKGLSIQGMQIERLTDNNYQFKLILTHVSKNDKVVEGNVEIVLEGLQNEVTREINITDLNINSSFDLSFKFKNFKRFEGNIVIPEGFSPLRVLVKLQPKDAKLSMIKRVFNWSEILS